jgi:uncharacterized SAM-binding protein YcdF (DUF218 family)
MLRRGIALVVMVWVLGFLAFAVTLPKPAAPTNTDAVVALTGGEGRIDRGLAVLRAHQARLLLVSGVDTEVRPAEFAAQYHVEPGLMQCCVTLGYQSVDTRSNAREAADWLAGTHASSVRLVTSDWHMRRAAWELHHAIPEQVTLIEDAVPSHPSFNTLFLEYNKYIARRIYRQGKK